MLTGRVAHGGSGAARPVVALLVTFTIGVLLAACQSDEAGSPTREPPVTDIDVVVDPSQIVLPADSYLLILHQWRIPERAINILGRECMQRFGLDWPVVEPMDDNGRADHSRRYGIMELHIAQTHGYHPVDLTTDNGQSYEPTDLEIDVWVGGGSHGLAGQVPEGGCVGEATRLVEQGAPPAPNLDLQQVFGEAYERAEQDSRVVDAFERWSRCMHNRGYPYDSPWDANDDPQWWEADKPTDPEIQVAVADVECKRETNLVGTWFAVESAYQDRLIDEHAMELVAMRDYFQAVIDNATEIVEGRG